MADGHVLQDGPSDYDAALADAVFLSKATGLSYMVASSPDGKFLACRGVDDFNWPTVAFAYPQVGGEPVVRRVLTLDPEIFAYLAQFVEVEVRTGMNSRREACFWCGATDLDMGEEHFENCGMPKMQRVLAALEGEGFERRSEGGGGAKDPK